MPRFTDLHSTLDIHCTMGNESVSLDTAIGAEAMNSHTYTLQLPFDHYYGTDKPNFNLPCALLTETTI